MASLAYENYSDEELWRRTAREDRMAFGELYKRHWESMMVAAHNVLQDREVCMDIVQDVFSDLWLRRATAQISVVAAYLKTAVRNQVFKHLRRGYVTQAHLDTLKAVTFVNTTEQMVNYRQLQALYQQSVDSLPTRCREVFVLSRMEYLSVKEIAKKLNISPKTVEHQITKALKHLRANMGQAMAMLLALLG